MMEICAIVYFTYVVMKILVQTGISLGRKLVCFCFGPRSLQCCLGVENETSCAVIN